MLNRVAIGIAVILGSFLATLFSLDYFFGDLNKPWASYTPSVRALTGTLGSVTSTGSYKIIGSTVHVQMTITVSRNGTGGSGLQVALPVASKSAAVLVGRDSSTGPMVQGMIAPSAAVVSLFTYSNGYPGGDGKIIFISGTYEGL